MLAVYTGTAVNALHLIASDDNIDTSNLTSSVTLNVVAGTIYRIAVDGFKDHDRGRSQRHRGAELGERPRQ